MITQLDFEGRLALEKHAIASTLATLCKAAGVQYFVIGYHGYGDEGWAYYLDAGTDRSALAAIGEDYLSCPLENDNTPDANLEELASFISEHASAYAPDGFENNEGGCGYLIFDLETLQFSGRQASNYTDREEANVAVDAFGRVNWLPEDDAAAKAESSTTLSESNPNEDTMSTPYLHAESSVRKWGGTVSDYLDIHLFIDESKSHYSDIRHRALRHHSEGVSLCGRVFGECITLSDGREVPTRLIAERHIVEDCGRIPTLADWLSNISLEGWMTHVPNKLSQEATQ